GTSGSAGFPSSVLPRLHFYLAPLSTAPHHLTRNAVMAHHGERTGYLELAVVVRTCQILPTRIAFPQIKTQMIRLLLPSPARPHPRLVS
uniref:Uncharacterized protein n=1 Tax=Aegilops tauschii subsp. strangulata TaxID=200361 RepID=A0A453KAY6_AEGTS